MSSNESSEIQDFLIKLSAEDSSSLDDLLSSSTSTSSSTGVEQVFSSLTPFLFHPDYSTIAQSILTTILQKKPTLLPVASSCIHSHILHNLQPSDDFVVSKPLLQLMVQQMGMGNQASASIAIAIATQSSDALQHLCNIRPPLVQNVVPLLCPIPKDSTIMIRYYTLLLQIIPSIHGAMYEYIDETLWKPFLDGMADENDPLLQMSILELLDVSKRDDLLQDWTELDPILLQMVGVHVHDKNMDMDVDMDVDVEDDYSSTQPSVSSKLNITGQLHPFCAGAALRILAKRTGKHHIPPHHYIQILRFFAREMSGEVEKIGFIDGISTFCQSQQDNNNNNDDDDDNSNLKAILTETELLEEWLNLRRLGQSKMKVVVMNSIARVISSSSSLSSSSSSSDNDDPCMTLYQSISTVNDVGGGKTSTELIMEYAKSQVIELRLGAYEIWTALVTHTKRGAHVLMRHGGFFEYLCNRNLEDVKEGKELKYNLVKAVLNSEVRGLLASDIVQVLERVVEDGPYYVKQTRDVALE